VDPGNLLLNDQVTAELREAALRLRGWKDVAAIVGPCSRRHVKRLRSICGALGVDSSSVTWLRCVAAEGRDEWIESVGSWELGQAFFA
jgi:hypothetical protein